MRFGLFGGAKSADASPDGDSIGYGRYIDYVLQAEALGFSHIFMVEHHFTGVGQVSSSLNLLAYLAGRTSRIRLGTAVVVLPWHNPVLLAEQVATVDLLSNGRFDFGIGKGYRSEEFAGFCMDQAEAGDRFDETLNFLQKAWSSPGRFSFESQRWKFKDILVEPRPTQRPHPPLWMAAASPVSIRKAAQAGFSLLLDQTASFELSLQRARVYREEQQRLGIPRGNTKVALARGMQMVATQQEKDEALRKRREILERLGATRAGTIDIQGQPIDADKAMSDAVHDSFVGTPQDAVTNARRLSGGDIDAVLLTDTTGSIESLRIFAQEVIPEVEGLKYSGETADQRHREVRA